MEGEGCDLVEDGFWRDIDFASNRPLNDPSHEGNDYPDVLAGLEARPIVLSGYGLYVLRLLCTMF